MVEWITLTRSADSYLWYERCYIFNIKKGSFLKYLGMQITKLSWSWDPGSFRNATTGSTFPLPQRVSRSFCPWDFKLLSMQLCPDRALRMTALHTLWIKEWINTIANSNSAKMSWTQKEPQVLSIFYLNILWFMLMLLVPIFPPFPPSTQPAPPLPQASPTPLSMSMGHHKCSLTNCFTFSLRSPLRCQSVPCFYFAH